MYKIPATTLFLGKKLVVLPECPSTNTVATELSQNSNLAEGTVVITNHQLEGRGQRGNTWESQPGKNLTFSVVLKPVFLKVSDQFLLNQAVSLGIKDALVDYFPHQVKIKWPNDIMVDSKKICGILIENQVNGIYLQCAVAGIGLNVNQQEFNLPTATSILNEFGQSLNLNDLLEKVIKSIEVRYLQLRQHQVSTLKEDYLNALFWRNEKHNFSVEGKRFEGVILNIDEVGRLVVKADQQMKSFGFREITFLYE